MSNTLNTEITNAIRKAFADATKGVVKSEADDPGNGPGQSITMTPEAAAAIFAAGVNAGRSERVRGQRAMDRGAIDTYRPGSGIDTAVKGPDGVLGDRASAAFRARNAHALRTGGLNRAMETQGSGKRTEVQKAGTTAATDALAGSTLRAVSGATIRKSAGHAVNIENVYSAITSAGAKGVDYGRLAVGLGLPDEEVHLCVAELKAAGRVTLV